MQTVTFSGNNYNVPTVTGDTPWTGLSDLAVALAGKAIATGGGAYTLTADINFGASFGIISTYFKSRTANVATAGQIRLAKTDVISFRNNLNDGNIDISKNTSNELLWNGSRLLLAGGGLIVDADISAAAAIAVSKLAALTVSRALVSDGSGVITPATTTATEIGYVNGVTSAIQTQLNTKSPSASPTFTGTVTLPVTADRALQTGTGSALEASATTKTELGYVSGVTSAIQTQMNLKAPLASPTFSGTLTAPTIAFTTPGTQGITGGTAGTAVGSGLVGQILSANATGVSVGTSPGNITSLAVTAGVWLIFGCASSNAGGTPAYVQLAINTTSASYSGVTEGISNGWYADPAGQGTGFLMVTANLSGTTTYYLVASCGSGTAATGGSLRAVRIA